jgi:hypothetical protein
MDPLDILKLIQENNQQTKDDLSIRFDDYNKSISTLFTTEMSDMKGRITDLKDQVVKQNGSVRDLREWKVDATKDIETLKTESKDRKVNSRNLILFVVGQVIFIAVFMIGLYVNNSKAHKKMIEDIKTEVSISKIK